MSKKILYINGSFHTRGDERVDALYTVDGKIEKLGQACDMICLRGEADEVVDFEGKYIYPDFSGFIEEVEFDCSEAGEEMLNVYFKKMAKKAFRKETDMYLEEGNKCDFAVYPVDLLRYATENKYPDAEYLIVDGEIFYDEAEFADEQWMWLLASQQY